MTKKIKLAKKKKKNGILKLEGRYLCVKKGKNITILLVLLNILLMLDSVTKKINDSQELSYKNFFNRKNSRIRDFINLNRSEDKLVILNQGNYQNKGDMQEMSYNYQALKNGLLIIRWHSLNYKGRLRIYINDTLAFDLSGKTDIIFKDFEVFKGDKIECIFYYGHIDYFLSMLF